MLAAEEGQIVDVIGSEDLRRVVGRWTVVEAEVIGVCRHVAAVRGIGGHVFGVGVGHAQLQAVGLMVHADLQRVVVIGEYGHTADNGRVAAIRTDVVHAGVRGRGLAGGHGGLVQVDFTKKVTRQVADVSHFHNGVGQEHMLHRDIEVGVVGHLECGRSCGSDVIGPITDSV